MMILLPMMIQLLLFGRGASEGVLVLGRQRWLTPAWPASCPPSLQREHPRESLPVKLLSQMASAAWKVLTEAQRAPYAALSTAGKERYRRWKEGGRQPLAAVSACRSRHGCVCPQRPQGSELGTPVWEGCLS